MEIILTIILIVFVISKVQGNTNKQKFTKEQKEVETTYILDEDKKKTVPFGYVNFSGKLVRQENLDRHFCPDIRSTCCSRSCF